MALITNGTFSNFGGFLPPFSNCKPSPPHHRRALPPQPLPPPPPMLYSGPSASLARKARIDAVAAWQHAEPPCRHTSSTVTPMRGARMALLLLLALPTVLEQIGELSDTALLWSFLFEYIFKKGILLGISFFIGNILVFCKQKVFV